LITGGVLLTVFSKFFADELSRALEATFDFIEISLASRARNNAERLSMRQSGEGQRFGETQFGIPAERRSAA
ncbi:MAG: hypothetical protein LC742_03555, partial [Acidobacteria bacterium]|nr:hypothetical protein [Acidobacteriota bacterium]